MLFAAITKELKLLSRDLHGLAVLFVMPILFMFIMSVALSKDADPHEAARVTIAGFSSNTLNQNFAALLQEKKIQVQQAPHTDLARLQTELQNGSLDMVIYNPNERAEKLTDDQALQLFISPSTDRAWLLGMKGVLQQHYTQQRLDSFFDYNADSRKKPKNAMERRIQKDIDAEQDKTFASIDEYLAETPFEEVYVSQTGTVAKPTSVQHSVPAWLIFGMFFIMIPLSNVMAMERQTNTLTRLRMAQAPAGLLLVSKLLPYFGINLLQFAGMVLLGYYVLPQFGVNAFELTGSYWSYIILAAAISLSALGYGLLVSVLARTTEQAVVLGGGGIIIMAAVGGIMVPSYVMPDTMQTATLASPMAWALRAFHDILLNRYTFAQVQHYIGLLALFGLICLLAATVIYNKQLKTQVRF